jgi:hypothetical protein
MEDGRPVIRISPFARRSERATAPEPGIGDCLLYLPRSIKLAMQMPKRDQHAISHVLVSINETLGAV